MPNRLATQQSPYLLQHAENPVDWYPWGPEALARARAENKPILVSIGYSACHWCHVMAHESFEDGATARLMNEHFINIKVDREERPDVDALYMEAVQAMTGHGGWPLNVFLTPDGRPFYGGTYFPPASRHGLPGWPEVLSGVAETYRARPDDVSHNASVLTDYIRRAQRAGSDSGTISARIISSAYEAAEREFDWTSGGFGGAPKFPQPLALDLLLRMEYGLGKQRALEFATFTLGKMAAGGIFDQLGGGFHRYSVDASWTVPHFEKMLYDNALLARVYAHAFQRTHDPLWAEICTKTLDYLVRDLRGPHGAFYAAEDADSEGEEGKFYVWTPEEFREVLGDPLAQIAGLYYGVTPAGNFEGRTILTQSMSIDDLARQLALTTDEVRGRIEEARGLLLARRAERVRPGTDTKVLAGWNGLAIQALAEAGAILRRTEYVEYAQGAMEFILESMRPGGRLVRSYGDAPGEIPAFLEDYAMLVEALVSLYETSGSLSYLREARSMASEMIARFWDPDASVFFDAEESPDLIARPRSLFDNPIPSGNSSAAFALLRLAALDEAEELERYAGAIFQVAGEILERAPLAVPYLCSALDFWLTGPVQVAIVQGSGESPGEILSTVFDRFIPSRVLATGPSEEPALVRGRAAIGGVTTAYVCRQFACQLPVTDAGSLARQLEEQRR